MQFIFPTHPTRTCRAEDIVDSSLLSISILNYLQTCARLLLDGEKRKTSQAYGTSSYFSIDLGRCPHTTPPPPTPEKDNSQCQRFHTRSVAIAAEVRASANGRGVRGEKIEAKRNTRKAQGREQRDCDRWKFGCCERWWWWWCCCVVIARASPRARRCGLRGYCDGQSTARARGGAKAASPQVSRCCCATVGVSVLV